MKNVFVKNCGVAGHLSRQRGASLLEGIAYLGIAALVILGAVSLLATAFGNAQANRATEETISLRTAVRKLYSGQTYPIGDAIVKTIITARAVPGTLNTDTATFKISNSWGGAVTIVGAGATFDLTYASVPQDVCVNMLSGATGWKSITGNAGAADESPQITAEGASKICSLANNSIVFTAG
jgi:hypothetical protein